MNRRRVAAALLGVVVLGPAACAVPRTGPAGGIGAAPARVVPATARPTSSSPSGAPARPAVPWVTSWTASVGGSSGGGFTATTLRQVVHLSVGGTAVRVTLSNVTGTTPLTVARTTVATSAGAGAVVAGSLQTVTFHGRVAVSVPAGGTVTSDPVARAVPDRADLAVSTALPGPTGGLDVHVDGGQPLFVAGGDAATSTGAGFEDSGSDARYVLAAVEVRPLTARETVVFLGDSLTDGFHATAGADARYPDVVAERWGPGELPGIANAGISGNMLLAPNGVAGAAGLDRFVRDAVDLPGVRVCVVLLGINDIDLRDATADQLAAGYRALAAAAHAAGIELVGATLPPDGGSRPWTAARERQREAANAFIRTAGVFDAVVDLDAAVRDPAAPSRLLPAFDSGDHLHPDDAGYRAMAEAVLPTLRSSLAVT